VEARSKATDFRNRSWVLQDLRVVTLEDPGEDETRVDPVAGREVQRTTSVKIGFSESRVLAHIRYFDLAFQT
jgi:hypothetical protein